MLVYILTRDLSPWLLESLILAAMKSEVLSVSSSYQKVSCCHRMKAVELSLQTWNHWKHETRYTILLCGFSQTFCYNNRMLTDLTVKGLHFGLDLADWPAVVLTSHGVKLHLGGKKGQCYGECAVWEVPLLCGRHGYKCYYTYYGVRVDWGLLPLASPLF